MRLEIGSRAYELEYSLKPLTHAGQRTASICDHDRRRIVISSTIPKEIRSELTALAVTEAWKREMIQRPPITFVGDVG